jgi:hypothetical protein
MAEAILCTIHDNVSQGRVFFLWFRFVAAVDGDAFAERGAGKAFFT